MRALAPRVVPILALTVVVMATEVRPSRACSMCGCGDPSYRIVGDEFFGASPWRFGFDIDRTGKDAAADEPGLTEHENETRFTPSVAWSPMSRLRLVGRLPVIDRRIETGDETNTMFGLSDPELAAHVQVTPPDPRRWVAVMVGVRSPWGQNDRTVDGVRADEHLQPGTGAVSWCAGVSATTRVRTREHLYASVISRWNTENRFGYRYGDVVLANLSYQRELVTRVAGVLELNGREARFDRVDGVQAANTGGSVLYVSPRAQWQLSAATVLRLGLQIPIVQRELGDQHEHTNLITGVTLAY